MRKTVPHKPQQIQAQKESMERSEMQHDVPS